MKVFSKIIKISGGTIVFVCLLGGILGMIDYVVVISGAELPKMDWAMAGIGMTAGAILYGLGYLMTKKFGDIDTETTTESPKLDMKDLGFIVNALKKTRRRGILMGFFFSIFGLFMIILPVTMNETTGIIIGLGIFGALCLLIGVFGFVQFSKLKNIEMSEIYRLIMFTPQKITGLTAQIVKSGYGKIGQAINANIIVDKKNIAALSISENDLELLKQYLLKHNPNLVFETKVQTA